MCIAVSGTRIYNYEGTFRKNYYSFNVSSLFTFKCVIIMDVYFMY